VTSSCMYCHDSLGTNELLPGFPVGRRIAFDPQTGRLWVVCPACSRWGLAPIDVRWEVVRECERLFRKSSRSFAEGGLGLAEIEGVELIQIGEGGAAGLASWRYGDVFKGRFRSWRLVQPALFLLGTAFVVLSALAAGLLWGPGGAVTVGIGLPLLLLVALEVADPVVAKIPAGNGAWHEIRRRGLEKIRLAPNDTAGWELRLGDGTVLMGAEAMEAVALLLPLVNDAGGADVTVRRAADYIVKKGQTADAVFRAAARRYGEEKTARLARLDPHIRLALEMLSHEESERRALAGELRYLKRAWQEAEGLARIEDHLATPRSVTLALRRLRATVRR